MAALFLYKSILNLSLDKSKAYIYFYLATRVFGVKNKFDHCQGFIGIPSLAVNTLKRYLYLVPLPVPHYVRGNLLPVSNLSDNKTALSSKKVYGCFIVEYTVNVRFVFYVLWGGDDLRKNFFIFFVGMKSRISKNKRCKNALRNLGIQLGICNSLKGAKT